MTTFIIIIKIFKKCTYMFTNLKTSIVLDEQYYVLILTLIWNVVCSHWNINRMKSVCILNPPDRHWSLLFMQTVVSVVSQCNTQRKSRGYSQLQNIKTNCRSWRNSSRNINIFINIFLCLYDVKWTVAFKGHRFTPFASS